MVEGSRRGGGAVKTHAVLWVSARAGGSAADAEGDAYHVT